MVYYTPIASNAPANSPVVNAPMGQLDQAIWSALHGHNPFTQKNLYTGSGVVITAAGGITANYAFHTIDTFGGAASDDLDTITPVGTAGVGPTKTVSLILSLTNNARTVTIRHGAGNIFLSGGANITLDDTRQSSQLFYNPIAGVWTDVGQESLPDNPFPLVPWTTLGADDDINITGISQAYQHLLFVAEWNEGAVATGAWFCRINNDSAGNYTTHYTTYSNTLPVGTTYGSTNTFFAANMPNGASAYRAVTRLLILNYASTTAFKRIIGHNFTMDSAGTQFETRKMGVVWKKSPIEAVNRLHFMPTGSPAGAGTQYALYGLM